MNLQQCQMLLLKEGQHLRSVVVVAGTVTNDYSQNKLLFTAGLMERQGTSLEEQTMAMMDHIEKYWKNMDLSDQKMFEGKS